MKNNIKEGKINNSQDIILDIKRLGINGEGIGFYNKKAIFVNDAIPGEGHKIKIVKDSGKMAFATSLENLHPSKSRIEPKCKEYGKCGGCNTMHIEYSQMLKFKRDILIESLERYSGVNPRSFEISQTIPSDKIFGYRSKCELPLEYLKGKTYVCMIKPNSNILINISSCPIQDELINEILDKIIKLIDENNIIVYNQKKNSGSIKKIVIRINNKNEALICFILNEKDEKILKISKELIKDERIKGIYQNINKKDEGSSAFGDVMEHLLGEKYIIETIGKIKYMVYPDTFFQLNLSQAEKMFEIVKKKAKLSFNEKIFDAYCGVGAIALYLAHNSKEVVGAEYNKNSIALAKENAKLNKISNARFLQGDSAEVLRSLLEKGETFDIIVADPPREGLDDKFINMIIKSNVKKFIYVSCNPATLAKNINILKDYYNVTSITPLDMFPNTAHVETICVLTKKMA